MDKKNVGKATLKFQSKPREDFWILKLDTLSPKGLNQELYNVQSRTAAFYSSYFTILLQLREACNRMTFY